MSSLERHRFIINTGKGGVGKTTVSVMQALALAARGRRVLLMEFNTSGRVSAALGIPDVGPEIVEVRPNLWVVNTTPADALREYALMILRIKALYRAVFENRVVDKLLRVMPGLPELTMLGKAFYHEAETVDGRPRFDTVILDAPATGHGMFLLQIPQVITRALGSGHMAEQARAMLALLEDGERTIVNLVTLPEEMPVLETIEMAAKLRESFRVKLGYVVVNAVLPEWFDAQDRAALDAARHAEDLPAGLRSLLDGAHAHDRRRAMQLRYMDTLRDAIDAPQLTVPFISESLTGADVLRDRGEAMLRDAEALA